MSTAKKKEKEKEKEKEKDGREKEKDHLKDFKEKETKKLKRTASIQFNKILRIDIPGDDNDNHCGEEGKDGPIHHDEEEEDSLPFSQDHEPDLAESTKTTRRISTSLAFKDEVRFKTEGGQQWWEGEQHQHHEHQRHHHHHHSAHHNTTTASSSLNFEDELDLGSSQRRGQTPPSGRRDKVVTAIRDLASPPKQIIRRQSGSGNASFSILPRPLSPTSLPKPYLQACSPEKGSVLLQQRTLSPEIHSPLTSPLQSSKVDQSRVISPPNSRLLSPPFSSLFSSSSAGQILPPSLPSRNHRTLRERALEQKKFYESLHATWHQGEGVVAQNQDGDSAKLIVLDIGGTIFRCSRSTLLSTTSMLSAMFSGRHSQKPDSDGNYFIDRDPTHFPFILNWLRDPTLSYLDYNHMITTTLLRILKESLFYQIHKLNEELLFHYSKRARREWTHPWLHLSENDLVITRREMGGDAWCFAIVGDPLLHSVGGVHYWEVLIHHTARQTMMGIMPPYPRKVHNTHIGKIPDGRGYHCNGHLYQNNTCHGFGPTYTNGDRVGTLLDLDKGKISWFINGEQTQTVSVATNPKGYVFAIALSFPKDCVEILPNADCFPGGWEIEERKEDHQGTPFDPTNSNYL